MKRSILLLMLLASAAAPAAAQRMTPMVFGVNGVWWNNAGDGDSLTARREKLAFVQGLYDGLVFGAARDAYAYPMDVPWETVLGGLDTFYDNPLNREVLVAYALRILNLRLQGHPQTEIDRATRYERCVVRARAIEDPVKRDSVATVCQHMP
jgi:hypothetical protein